MNRLQFETSPYLLQHAHNPVDWFAWKPEAFERARQEDKPILVSIGYSTCHWCHVMERESFENETTASLMNSHFICIKVDREERPDVDHIYMEACQILSGAGGWPLNCFLTPDGRPFFAGTYYPPIPAHNRPSWTQVLQNLAHAFQNRREEVEQQADKLVEIIKNTNRNFLNDELLEQSIESVFQPTMIQQFYYQLQNSFDIQFGGFGTAPKFPGSMSLQLLLQYHHYTGEEAALEHVLFSLDKMIEGGIYDQIGGGFARYATDRQWLIPHFEKMLYDNALLVGLLADVYAATGKKKYSEILQETLAFIAREMTSPTGGFYAALDADSEGEEGKYYTWKSDEIVEVLGEEAIEFMEIHGVSSTGNWEGKNILYLPVSLEEYAQKRGYTDPTGLHKIVQEKWPKLPDLNLARFKEKLKGQKSLLLECREKRIKPGLDDKILLGWNALQCKAYAKAYAATGIMSYAAIARKNLNFLLTGFKQPNSPAFFHTYKEGHAQYDAFLNDYAYVLDAILAVYGIHFNLTLLDRAADICDFVIEQFLDREHNLFYFTSIDQQDIPVRKKELYDSAVPSGNSTMALVLLQLGTLLDRTDYTDIAITMLKSMSEAVEKYPGSFARWASAILAVVYGQKEIAICGDNAMRMAFDINAKYIPFKVMMATEKANEKYPLLKGKGSSTDTNIYVCENYVCQMPVKTIADFDKLIR